MITYHVPHMHPGTKTDLVTNVLLDGKVVGSIWSDRMGGFYYMTNSFYKGETFRSVEAVKRSIEG